MITIHPFVKYYVQIGYNALLLYFTPLFLFFFSLLTCIAFMFPPRGMSLTSFAYQLERRHVRQKRTTLEFACVYKHTYTNVRILIHVLNDSIYNIYPHHFTNDYLSVLPFSRSSPSWLLLSFQACILYLRLEAKVQIGYSAPFG